MTVLTIAIIIALAALAYVVIRRGLTTLVLKGSLSDAMSHNLLIVARWTLIIVALLLVLQQIGIQIAGVWQALLAVAALVAVGFIAVWSVLSNMLCCILIMTFGRIKVGDDIEIVEGAGAKGLRGTVTALNLLFTSIKETGTRSADEVTLQVPNNVFFQKTIRRRVAAEAKTPSPAKKTAARKKTRKKTSR
jgi:small-conductance mechanosensitive channel